VRTNGVVIEGRHTSPDEVRRFYLRLSERTAADGIKWERGSTADGIVELASANAFDPVLDAVLALTSGVEPLGDDHWKRLDRLMLGVDDDVAAVFLPKYLIGAIARLFQPGAKVDQTLVLIGNQGIGKSQWGQCLFGLDPSFVVDHLGSRLDKDDITRMHRAWAVELGELDGIVRRTDQEAFKAFLTRQTDVIRRPYGASDEEMPRRTIFFGTSNGAPLKDLTGSRRFVCVGLPDKALPLQNLLEHRAALWARAIAEYKNGGQWWSNKEESEDIKAQNADFQTIDPWADVICMFLACCPNAYCTISEAFERLEVPIERRNNANTLRLRQIIEQQGWAYGQRRIGGNVHRGFWKPSKPPSEDMDLF
jgi:predicted P-loop ATPase